MGLFGKSKKEKEQEAAFAQLRALRPLPTVDEIVAGFREWPYFQYPRKVREQDIVYDQIVTEEYETAITQRGLLAEGVGLTDCTWANFLDYAGPGAMEVTDFRAFINPRQVGLLSVHNELDLNIVPATYAVLTGEKLRFGFLDYLPGIFIIADDGQVQEGRFERVADDKTFTIPREFNLSSQLLELQLLGYDLEPEIRDEGIEHVKLAQRFAKYLLTASIEDK